MSHIPIQGMMTRETLESSVRKNEIETVLTVFPDMYGRLVGKRVNGAYFMDEVMDHGMHCCDYLLACDMEMDPIPGYKFTSWESGYGDFHCVPDISTLRLAAWLPKTALVFCDLFKATNHHAVSVSPRGMLRKQIERAKDAGFTVFGGSEIELYLFNESYESAKSKHYHNLQTSSDFSEDYHIFQTTKEEDLIGAIRRGLDGSGVPVESTKGEWGAGQQEINIRYSDALSQADRNVIYKHAAKEIAYAQGKAVTFMAKWNETQAGSSMHVHLSLRESDGKTSSFEGDKPIGPVEGSDNFRWFLGGWIKHSRELAACYAPYVSSYKRYQPGSFAPTSVAWSHDNRTAGFRVVGSGPSLRIECRIPGADANPYILYAAAIASGLDGIENKIEPPPVFDGDIYQAASLTRVPGSLREAIVEFERSDLARKAFGTDVVEHYLHFLRTEQRKFDEVITDWEKARYFERA